MQSALPNRSVIFRWPMHGLLVEQQDFCREGHNCDIHSLGAWRCKNGAASQRRICIFSGWGNVLTQACWHAAREHSGWPSTPHSRWLCFPFHFVFLLWLYISLCGLHTLCRALSFQNWPSRSSSSVHIVTALHWETEWAQNILSLHNL